MKRGSKPLQAVSPTNGQTIHGWLRPTAYQVIPERVDHHSPAGLLLPNPFAAMPAAHPFAAVFDAMRLTSGKSSLQSP